MRWFIASDIHGSKKYCNKMMEAFHVENADRMLLLGDFLNHGPRNGLPEDYDPIVVSEILNVNKNDIVCVQGNCDSEVDQMCLDFPVTIKEILIPVGKNILMATHGHVFNKTCLPPHKAGDVLLYGHTHVPMVEKIGDIVCMNPGSISIPKEGSCHSYMIWEDRKFQWKNLMTGETYLEYVL